ncbi:dipicolinate synthase subunit DpsA [Salibacterium halotolerans]|uniref:Dipicolinate synthase subunit A n=1 Tax=Salibacterium halotolerans TaxID=1884432 RepID=A0A1I5MHU9_9BACI|nr:dipicolinate synthase subunit DpsA [Salibacterium halotolerans]SFP09172.1 dipicolinate synthase subunit A [Salibacterium halotolerans]
MKKNILLAGGDERQLEMGEYLYGKGMSVTMLGFSNESGIREEIPCYQAGEELEWERLDAVVFPSDGIHSGFIVHAPLSTSPLKIEENWLRRLPPESLIFTGISSSEADQCMEKTDRTYTALLEQEETALYNAVPTAEGVLLTAIQRTDRTIHRSRVVILGFGRTGSVIARTFFALGAYAEVGTKSPTEKARAETYGHSVFLLDELPQALGRADIVINTIPAFLLTKSMLQNVSRHTLIIDIASRPGGTDFSYALEKGITALWTPGLPGRTAPKTAGYILGNVLLQLLEDTTENKEDRHPKGCTDE